MDALPLTTFITSYCLHFACKACCST